ncbi:MAG: AI-2E family transporter [Candidatus Auribacterota bacterium]|jgi:predicted PurR-regulated permease PerM|nr:AI-2E family transporter [Candidatus Auribacterota bacterium]
MDSDKLKIISACLLFGAVIATVYILVIGSTLLIPLVIAVIIWYLINSLTVAYKNIPFLGIRMPHWFLFGMALLTILILLWAVFTLITSNITDVVNAAPVYQEKLVRLIARVIELLHIDKTPTVSQLINSVNLGKIIPQFASVITGIAGNAGIILLYVFFLLMEQKSFDGKLSALAKNEYREDTIRKIIGRIDTDIRRYIGIKSLMSLITAFLSYLVMRYVGVDFAVFWAVLIFIFNYIPTIGSILATAFPSLLALLQFDTLYPFFVILFGITALQFAIGNVLEPKIMGNTLNLSPLGIILSLALWGTIWGVIGMFLCVPIMVIITIILAQFPKTRPIAVILSKNGLVR